MLQTQFWHMVISVNENFIFILVTFKIDLSYA